MVWHGQRGGLVVVVEHRHIEVLDAILTGVFGDVGGVEPDVVVKRLGVLGDGGVPRADDERFQNRRRRIFLAYSADLFSLQRILGHTNQETTSKYVNMARTDVKSKH